MRRFKCQHLTLFAQGVFNFYEWRAGACRQHQFARLVFDDAAVLTQLKEFAGQGATIKILAAAAAYAQGGTARLRRLDLCGQ